MNDRQFKQRLDRYLTAEPDWDNEDIFDDDDIPNDPITCPACYSPNIILLGTLGNLTHYDCRQCGMQFNIQVEGYGPPEAF